MLPMDAQTVRKKSAVTLDFHFLVFNPAFTGLPHINVEMGIKINRMVFTCIGIKWGREPAKQHDSGHFGGLRSMAVSITPRR